MKQYDVKGNVHEDGRRRPIGYILSKTGHRDLAVIGHYETPCGGCDTIPKMEHIFELVRQSHAAGMDVVFEGLLISADSKRTLLLYEDELPLTVVALTTPIEICLAGINDRRIKRMGDKYTPVNPKNTEAKYKGVKSSMTKLQDAGVDARWCSREEAAETVRRLLDV